MQIKKLIERMCIRPRFEKRGTRQLRNGLFTQSDLKLNFTHLSLTSKLSCKIRAYSSATSLNPAGFGINRNFLGAVIQAYSTKCCDGSRGEPEEKGTHTREAACEVSNLSTLPIFFSRTFLGGTAEGDTNYQPTFQFPGLKD